MGRVREMYRIKFDLARNFVNVYGFLGVSDPVWSIKDLKDAFKAY